jgi:lysophospholipase L1-like esterase
LASFRPSFEPDSDLSVTSLSRFKSRIVSIVPRGEARTRPLLRIVAGLIAFGIGCGESTAPPVPVVTVVLTPAAVELVPGGTDILQAIPRDAAGNGLTNRITEWSTSDPSKLTVAAGVLTGVAVGSATVTASVEGHVASMEVKVKEGMVVSASGASFVAQSSVVALTIPSGALAQTTNISVAPAATTPPSDRLMPGTAFEFGPNGTSFAQQVTISIKYDPSKLAVGNLETGLRLYEVVGTGWRLVDGSTVNTVTKTVTGAVSHFTVYGVLMAGPPATATIFAGNNQTGTAGGLVATAPAVKVTDADGTPIQGFTVVFVPAAGSGSVTDGTSITNASGVAAPTSWILGTTPGAQSLTATAGTLAGSPLTFSASAVAPIPVKIVLNGGDGQTAGIGTAVPVVPAVRVVDAANIGVPGYTVSFTVTSGGGAVTGGEAVTNINGFASVASWVLGPNGGPNTLTATAGTLQGSPIVFTATGVAAPPVAMAISAGNQQSAPANAAVPVNPAVLVTDADGKGVPNITVAFTVRSGTGSITGANAVTNASGIATLGSWTLGIGGNSLFAAVDGLSGSPLIFVGVGTVQVQLVTFGDSNTDFGFAGTDPSVRAASYVSDGNPGVRLAPDARNSSYQLAGKIEAQWRASRVQTIRVVNHAIAGTNTGAGRDILTSPNAREAVDGVTRFQGEALGVAYPWNGGESTNDFFPNGSIPRVQAFSPRPSDFLYISMGTNDVASDVNFPTSTSLANLEWMIDQWVSLGLSASHVMLTTLPPRTVTDAAKIRNLNDGIRALAQRKGVKLIDLVMLVSNDNGGNWSGPSVHVDDYHYSEQIRDQLATNVVSYMASLTP